jgi:hypothetical protein
MFTRSHHSLDPLLLDSTRISKPANGDAAWLVNIFVIFLSCRYTTVCPVQSPLPFPPPTILHTYILQPPTLPTHYPYNTNMAKPLNKPTNPLPTSTRPTAPSNTAVVFRGAPALRVADPVARAAPLDLAAPLPFPPPFPPVGRAAPLPPLFPPSAAVEFARPSTMKKFPATGAPSLFSVANASTSKLKRAVVLAKSLALTLRVFGSRNSSCT